MSGWRFGDGDFRVGGGLSELLDAQQSKPKRKRKPSIRKMIADAEKSGKNVTSITTPDGTTLTFGEPQPTEARNPWLADIERATKQ